MQPLLSVVIPARNAPFLPRTLASLERQAPGLIREVLVVGDARPDTGSVRGCVRFLPTERPVTSPVARNIGIRAAVGPWLAFLDADCEAAPEWAAALLKAGAGGHPVVGGGVEFGRCGYWADVHNVSMLHEYHVSAPAGDRTTLPSLNLLVHRDVIARVGSMDETLRRAQDFEWTSRMYRAGIRPWFEPAAKVLHFPARAARSLWRDYYETGRNSFQVRARRADEIALAGPLRSPASLRLLSPAIAAGAVGRIYWRNPRLLRHLGAAPGIWITKLAWCLGAAAAS